VPDVILFQEQLVTEPVSTPPMLATVQFPNAVRSARHAPPPNSPPESGAQPLAFEHAIECQRAPKSAKI